MGILDSADKLVVEYKYDTRDKPLATTGSLADTLGVRNPFRYREYVFNDETKLAAVFAYSEEEGDYDLLDTYPVGFQTSLGVSYGVDFAHIVKSYTIVSTLDSRNYSLLGRSKNRYTVRSSASKFRVEMDR